MKARKLRISPAAAPAAATPRRTVPALTVPAAIALLAVIAFAGTLAHDFTLDDVEIVRENPRIASMADIGALYRDDYWGHIDAGDHALYRPTTLASYALGRAIHGPGARAHHAVNVLLHAAASVALFALVRSLFRDGTTAFAGAALFAVHPIHVEAVAGIVGRAEILAFLGILATVAAARRGIAAPTPAAAAAWIAAAAAACFAGATSKETGIVAPAVVALTEWVAPAKRGRPSGRIAVGAALLGAVALVLALRAAATSGSSTSTVFESASFGERRLTALRVLGENVAQLLLPLRLSAEYGPREVPIATSLFQPGVLLGAAILIGLGAAFLRARTRLPAVAWGLGFFVITLLPVSNLLISIGVARAERLLYSPSAGFLVALAAAVLAWAATPSRRRMATGILAVVLLLALVRTIDGTRAWRDNCTLAASTLRSAPESPIFLTMSARCLMDAGDDAGSRALVERAFAARPDFPTAHVLAGMLEERAENVPAALAHYDALLAREPRHLVALSRSAVLLMKNGRPAEAAVRYSAWCDASPNDPRPWAGLVAATAQAGDLPTALEIGRRALLQFPNDPDLRRNTEVIERALTEFPRP